MKKLSLILGATALSCLTFGWVGLIALFAILIDFRHVLPIAGSYPNIATTTLSDYVTQNSKVQEQLWIDRILDTNGASYQECPFADGMTGRVKVGKAASHAQLNKAVVEITDTRKVRGDTINIFSTAGIGGEGATGDNVRNGTEAQIVTGNMTVQIGNQLFAVGYKQSAVDKSMIGQDVTKSQDLNDKLRHLHNKRKNATIIWRMLSAAGYGASGFLGTITANNIYPPGVANRAALRSADTVDMPLITYACDYLPGIGAMPMDTAQDGGGSVGELFMFLSPDKALVDFENDPTTNQYLQYAWDRGAGNPLFAGGLRNVRGHGLYRWIHRDHANYDNIGSPLMPRAKLSVATTNADAIDLRGGGVLSSGTNVAATDTVPQWFKDFSNGPVTMYGGIANIGATTASTRYAMVIGSGGYSVWSYTVNNGNKITTTAKQTSTATTPYVHAIGDLVVECNAAGCVFGRSIAFGAQAVVGGIGSINGNPADPQMGVLRKQVLDLENDVSLGVEGCGGYAAVKRAGDGAFPSYTIVEHAISVPGAPVV